MADQLPESYWEALGENGAFLKVLLAEVQQLQQLQMPNQELQNHLLHNQNHLVNAASAAAVTAAQKIIPPAPPTIPSSTCPIKVTDPENFSGDCAETEGFIRAIRLSITVQPGSFLDECTKVLYALSFMTGGSAQIWAQTKPRLTSMGLL
jgi:hypothetical protein